MVQITKVSVENVSHPGINYLIKHVGCIFRRLFSLALEDIKTGEQLSSTFKLLPTAVEKHFLKEFDVMLWALMQNAANMTHLALEPMVSLPLTVLVLLPGLLLTPGTLFANLNRQYSTVDPNLPTFHALGVDQDEGNERYTLQGNNMSACAAKLKNAKHHGSNLQNPASKLWHLRRVMPQSDF
jgi:hypothetical protein